MKLSMVSFAMNEIAASIALIMTIFRAKKQKYKDASWGKYHFQTIGLQKGRDLNFMSWHKKRKWKGKLTPKRVSW